MIIAAIANSSAPLGAALTAGDPAPFPRPVSTNPGSPGSDAAAVGGTDATDATDATVSVAQAVAKSPPPPPPPPPPPVDDSVHISQQAQVRLFSQQGSTPSEIAYRLGLPLSEVNGDLFQLAGAAFFYSSASSNSAALTSSALAA